MKSKLRGALLIVAIGLAIWGILPRAAATTHFPLWTYQGTERVLSVDISADGAHIVVGTTETGGNWGNLSVFRRTSNVPRWTRNMGGSVIAAISADGTYVMAGASYDEVCVHYTGNWLPEWTDSVSQWVPAVALSATGNYTAALPAGDLALFDETGFAPLWTHVNSFYTLAISANGRYLAAGGADYRVYFFTNASSTPTGNNLTSAAVRYLAMSADGSYVAAGGYNSRDLYVLERSTANILWKYNCSGFVYSIAMSADGGRVAVGTSDGKIHLFDRTSPTPLWTFTAGIAGGSFFAVTLSETGDYLAAGNYFGIYMWDCASASPLWIYGHTTLPSGDLVESIAISADGTYVVAGTEFGKVHLFHRTQIGMDPNAQPDDIPGFLIIETFLTVYLISYFARKSKNCPLFLKILSCYTDKFEGA